MWTASRPWALYASALAVALAGSGFGLAEWNHLRENSRFDEIGPVCRVAVDSRVVALSIDDGPSPVHTPRILDLLREVEARATFFVVGETASVHPELVRRELRHGMEVGNHTWSHPDLTRLSAAERRRELERTQDLLVSLGAGSGSDRPGLARPPFGEIDAGGLRLARDLELTFVRWSIAVERYLGGLGMSPREAASVMAQVIRPGEIILAHDAGGDRPRNRMPTVETLRLLLPELKAKGYRIVSVGELLMEGRPVRPGRGRWIWDADFTCPR
jgi:peptidoglycan/xylan/chitin deacetylase (PgdA/CDA1 family)